MKKLKKEIIIYQSPKGAIELRGDSGKQTIWATQAQIVDLFGVDQSVVSRHVKNIFKDGQVEEKSNMQKMHIANSDKPVVFYSLDVILSIGYRTNSKVAIEFRKWATKVLSEHITKGYTINPSRIKKNHDEFLSAVEKVKSLLPAGMKPDTESILELIKAFADTWLSLDAYDKGVLEKVKATKKKVALTAHDLTAAIGELKSELMKKSEATEIFAIERSAGSVFNILDAVKYFTIT